MTFLRNILCWANLLLVLFTLLAYLAPFPDPSRIWHLTFFGLAYPFFLAGHLFFLVFWALKRDRYVWFSALCILAGIHHFFNFAGLNLIAPLAISKQHLRVMTYNVGGMGRKITNAEGEEKNTGTQLKQLAVRSHYPQILCVQEGAGSFTKDLILETFQFSDWFKEKSVYLFSKYPFTDKGIVPFGETSNSCLWADVKTPSGTLRVYCMHLQSNRMSYTAEKIATKGNLRKKETWRDIRFVLSRYKRAVGIRAQQARMVATHSANSPHPVIFCGDLNDPPVSYVYRLLSANKKDTFREKGRGIGTTFAGKLPALRIDYVLVDSVLNVKNHRVFKTELSDHYPVLAVLEWKK